VKILQLATVDNGGATWFLKDALDRHTDHETVAVRMYQNRCKYPADKLKPTQEEINELYEWADVVHLHDEAGSLIWHQWEKEEKPVVITYHGTRYRQHHEQYDQKCERRGWKVTVSTLDLATWGARWLPTPRRDTNEFWNPTERFHVIHLPTDLGRKRTEDVQRELEGFSLSVVHGQPYARAMMRKAKAHVTVDGWNYGYGNNSIEAWALGMPSVGGAIPEVKELMIKAWGYLPFVDATMETLRDVVDRLRTDDDFYKSGQMWGRSHFERFHRQAAVAARLDGLYQEVREKGGN
jgi:glycosyltransferase involved in cell wall biosynthesis